MKDLTKHMPLMLQFFADGGEGSDGSEGKEGKGSDGTSAKEGTEKKETGVDEKQIKDTAISEFLKSLGVEDADSLKGIVTKHKEDEQKNMTEIEKKDGVIKETTKQLADEKKERIKAQAAVEAMKMNANPKTVDDLVILIMAKVTQDKDVATVIKEIKESDTGKLYFSDKQEEEGEGKEGKNKNTVVTRKRVSSKPTTKEKEKKDDKGGEGKHSGTIAERLFANKKKVTKSSYFGN